MTLNCVSGIKHSFLSKKEIVERGDFLLFCLTESSGRKRFERNSFLKSYGTKDFIFWLFSLSLLNVLRIFSDTYSG